MEKHTLTKVAVVAGTSAAVVAPLWMGYKLLLRASQLIVLPLVGTVVWLGVTYVPPALVQQKLNAPPAYTQEQFDKALQDALAKTASDNLKRESDIQAAVEKALAVERASVAAQKPKMVERFIEKRSETEPPRKVWKTTTPEGAIVYAVGPSVPQGATELPEKSQSTPSGQERICAGYLQHFNRVLNQNNPSGADNYRILAKNTGCKTDSW